MAAAFSGVGDKGYQGSGYITPIKKPQFRELLEWEKEFNADVSRLRAPVERAIAHIKRDYAKPRLLLVRGSLPRMISRLAARRIR